MTMTSRPLTPDNGFSPNSLASSDLRTELSSSFESVRTKGYMRTVRNSMEDLKCPRAMEHAEYQARKMIQSLENAPEEDGGRSPNLYSNPAAPDVDVRLHKVLEAMLEHAEACGGSHGKRYTLAAICTAGRNAEDDIQPLRSLGVTWLSHFLWVFKANTPIHLPVRETSLHPSQIATPTRDSTDGVVNNPMHLSRPNKDVFRNLVLKRDDYRCCVTGWNDHEKPNLDPGVTTTKRLSACHIVGRVVGFLDKGTQPHVTIDSQRAAVNTLDIIRDYSNISEDEVECLTANIDTPQNCFILWHDVHESFDDFYWCLHPADTGRENEYKVKQYNCLRSSFDRGDVPPITVRFKDHSAKNNTDIGEPPEKKRRTALELQPGDWGVPVPNPLYIRIHAAVAGVLHMSGAAEAIDQVLKRFEDTGPAGDIFTAEDYESPVMDDLNTSQT